MEEIFYEDVLDTFLFCFIACFGIIQAMVARRGWHGLSVYGGRLKPALNYALGAVAVVFAYAWYFSDPLHRNVRNIEAFMSLVCLVLGILAAGAATALLSSLAEALRRRLGRGRRGRPASRLERMELPEGTLLASPAWGEPGENLVVVAEAGRGCEKLMHAISTCLPEGRGMLCLHPRPPRDGPGHGGIGSAVPGMLAGAERERGIDARGEAFMGLGWGGSALQLLAPELLGAYQPRRALIVAPVVPERERDFIGDALLSNTPLDVLEVLTAGRPWREAASRAILRLWLPVLAACVAAATAVTVGFDVRWKLFSGPMAGALISLWATYFLARWRGLLEGPGAEARAASRLRGGRPGDAICPFTVVLTADHGLEAAAREVPGLEPGAVRVEYWADVLRGKFLLGGETPARLAALIWEEGAGGSR